MQIKFYSAPYVLFLFQLPGRLLKRETIVFGKNFEVQANEQADWGRDATHSQVITAVSDHNSVSDYYKVS